MLIRFLVFCLGCGMLQTAAERTPFAWQLSEAVNFVPLIFVKVEVRLAVRILGVLSFPTELVLGFHLFRWWGLVLWLPSLWVVQIIFPGKNPGPCFFIGVLVTAVGLLLVATG